MTIKMILSTGINGEIGFSDGRLAFKQPEDMQYFKEQTLGHNVVMGMKTKISLPFDWGLPSRNNYVITRTPTPYLGGLNYHETRLEHLLNILPLFEKLGCKDTWVIGGKEIYTQMLDLVDEIHYTVIRDSNPQADVVMNMDFLYEGKWLLTSAKELCDNATVFVYKRFK